MISLATCGDVVILFLLQNSIKYMYVLEVKKTGKFMRIRER